MVDGVAYASLSEAIQAAAASSSTVRLAGDGESSGIAVAEGSDFVLDLNGHQLDVIGPGAGSKGTETNGLQFLKDSTIVIKNGTLVFDDDRLKMGIQNYSNLTLDNVKVSGGDTIRYVVSNNFGNVVFKNGTSITAAEGRIAFDAWYGMHPDYYDGVNVTIADDSVVISGPVEFGKANNAPAEMFATNASITCPADTELDVHLLTTPCEWTDNGDGTKTLRYVSE